MKILKTNAILNIRMKFKLSLINYKILQDKILLAFTIIPNNMTGGEKMPRINKNFDKYLNFLYICTKLENNVHCSCFFHSEDYMR